MDLAKQFAERAARAADRSPEGATIKLPEAESYWIGLPLSLCVFHRDIGDWKITVSPGAERKTVRSLFQDQDPVELSKCTQTDVLFFLLGLPNPETQTSVFGLTPEKLFRLILNVSPHAQCSVSGAGQRKYLNGRLDRLLPSDGETLTPQLVQCFYDEHDLGPEERKYFSSHTFSRDRELGEQDAGKCDWLIGGKFGKLVTLIGIKMKDVTVAQVRQAVEAYNQQTPKRAPSRPPQNKQAERNVGTQQSDWIIRWTLHQPTANENDWTLHIQIHPVADPANTIPLLQFARQKAGGSRIEARLRQHAARLADAVPDLASHCVVRRGAETSFYKDRVVLDCAAAERFIREWSTKLREIKEIEHKIVIPATLEAEYRKRVIVIRRKPIDFSSSSGLFTAEKLLKFRWDIVLHGEQIDVAELESLAEQKRALLLWQGK